jgi:SHS2 domain-containing protein
MPEAGHRQVEHTADLAIELWAPSEEELLGEGARALVEILAGGAAVSPASERQVQIESIDPSDRLVQWLNEVLYLASVEAFLVADAQIELGPTGLRATVRGSEQRELATEIKSATYHDLHVTQREGTWRARVVLDV